jgi:hypothetical protein
MKLFLLFSFIIVFEVTCAQTSKDANLAARKKVKSTLRHERKLERIKRANLRKCNTINKYYERTEGRKVKEIVYDFAEKRFEGGNPPYEIHELDGVRIKILNVNPFIYTADLFELQNDRINNEKLSEASQKINLKIAISPISSFKMKSGNLQSSKSINDELNKKEDSIVELRNSVHEPDSPEWQQIADKIFTIEQSKMSFLELAIDTIQQAKSGEKQSQKAKQREINQLESILSSNLEMIDARVTSVNNYVNFYNQLLYLVNSPENRYETLAKSRDDLFKSFGLGYEIDLVAGNYFRELQLLETAIKLGLKSCDELTSLDATSVSYEKIRIRIEDLAKELDKFNHHQLVGNLLTLYKLVNRENFILVYETQSISENVDNIRYKIEFKADNSFELPRSVGNFTLDFNLTILEGLKIDVSPAIVMDFGLVDPAFYFDKTTDSNGDEFVAIRRNTEAGNVSPSIGTILNAYKRGSTNFKFGGSMGFGLSNKLRFRLYMGPSLIVGRQERLVFTAGLAMGLVERLADEYTLDEVVQFPHSTLPNNVPVVADKFKIGAFFSIGFNLSGKQNKSFFEKIKFN